VKCIGIEIDYVYQINVNTFSMPVHSGFYQFYIVFLQMKNENISFKEIVARLKLVPADILDDWNNKYETEHPCIDLEHCMSVEISPEDNHVGHYQKFNFDNTLDALRYELDELLNETAQGMHDTNAGADDEVFLIMLEETTLFFHRYLTSITITPISANNYWIGFSISESSGNLVKQAKKVIHFYMKWIFTKKMQVAFSWN